jgi:hypothetical protein
MVVITIKEVGKLYRILFEIGKRKTESPHLTLDELLSLGELIKNISFPPSMRGKK